MALGYLTLEKRAADGLSGARWSFYLLDEKRLVVDSYVEFARESKRKQPREHRAWHRLGHKGRNTISQAEVPLTAEIMAEAKAEFIRQLEQNLVVEFQDLGR